ncbi:LysR substrate-binding domain-containing protein [Bradyrhizobium sp.]|jgi:DNA-binding transcriptional LysR family regulator|uniref:LysR substrate-binding domain-containing protein n=1 Tax=Bradyrhizobium sp. TaxID=376 RepID=UPI001DE7D5C1|nr:LysR substrate-binding domain-containing protein [Bradyrhizobium sp.]MBI5321838.1 LysR family transcriptional regulator [Bradyrhizobium sp.]
MALSRITLRQFEAFVTVADALSFAAAAERLGLTSSAVSQLVGELEGTLGFRVFDRSTRRVALSSAGREFLGIAQTVLRHVQLAETAAADVRNRAAGVVRIGAPLILASAVLPAAIRDFKRQRPNVAIHIRDVPVEMTVDRVAAGDIDLAIGPDRPSDPAVLRETIFQSPWVLWCAANHSLAARKVLRWEDLRNVALVAASRDHEISVAQMRNAAPEALPIAPVQIVDNITTALGLAAQGLAATPAPAYVGVIARPLGLIMRRIKRPEAVREVCLYRPARRSIPPAAEAFGEFLVHWIRKWNSKAQVSWLGGALPARERRSHRLPTRKAS